ncbi:protein kinase [Mycobacterium sp. 852002-51163_SCH5372311]|uniref:serine/threonine-protein kinase n=1 Tax=Mycobacterium sp. 852002-51163_SCH5372311 TaxID=1834097 RepID=UPI0007FCF277|nr:serine/threonine-protein kinase [Mycobacterium sp. 852002-51163_SCH5372311]OBF88006.1 protein kinase [Mycobacterium sp. 852002-51163_SCH5372311]
MADRPTTGSGRPSSGLAEELAEAGFENAQQVARGGAGVIYRCYETALGRNVAVKVLPSHFDEESRERFLREGYAMGGLSGHPNIVHILRVGVTPSGKPYIVMPYHAADSLAVRLRHEGPLPWPEALRIAVKLCGALETAHKTGTLHRDIKPANVLVNDYGEPLLSDFGIAHIEGGYETATGFFSGTIDYTAPEVMTGNPATVASDLYSLGATIYALIAGGAAHERKSGEDLIAQYLRISTSRVPDMRPEGIPDAVCSAIEKAMSIDPAARPVSAEQFGRELQAAQRSCGFKPDSMAITNTATGSSHTVVTPTGVARPPSGQTAAQTAMQSATAAESSIHGSTQHIADPIGSTSSVRQPIGPEAGSAGREEFSQAADVLRGGRGLQPPPPVSPPTGATQVVPPYADPTSISTPSGTTRPPSGPPSGPPSPRPTGPVPPSGRRSGLAGWFAEPGKKSNRIAMAVAAVLAVVLLVVGGLYLLTGNKKNDHNVASQPSTQAPVQWKAITNAPIARDAAATTQTDGTIWIFGGIRADGAVTAVHEGYDPVVDAWKAGADLPAGVQHAMAVTWQDNPIVLGGQRTESGNRVATDKVWRVVNGQWVELPHLLQPRSAGAAAAVGDRIIVTGGVGANGALLNTTEIFDGTAWTLGPPIPTPRQLLAGASDGKLMYAVGGSNGNADLTTVEAYDPAAKSWTALAGLPQPRSDLGVAIADGRLVAVGGVSNGEVLKSVSVLDLMAKTWDALPDMASPRHGMAVDAVDKAVYAVGGSTAVGDGQVVATAEVLNLPARKIQPASQWRSLPDAPTARLMMAWAVLNDKIWIMGGLRNGVPLQTVESYDPKTGVWQPGPPLPIPLHHAAAATYRGEVVVLGGESEKNIGNGTNKVFALRGNNWVELPSLKHARVAPAAAVVGDKLVAVGGQSAKQLVPQTEVFDGSSWKDAADMPTPREHLAAVSDGTYLYAIGGRFLSASKNTAALEQFDPASGKWTKLVGMPTPRGSYGAAYIDGRIVVVGGEEPTQVVNVVEMYDIADKKWSTLTPMPTSRHAEVVATVGNTVYVIGGANRPSHEGPIATVEALDFM